MERKILEENQMKLARAVTICQNINSDKFTVEEKALAIHEVMNMPTQNSINKQTLNEVIRWLWNISFELREIHEEDDCK